MNKLKDWLREQIGYRHPFYRMLSCVAHPCNSAKHAFRVVSRNSIFWTESEMAMCSLLPEGLLKAVLAHLRPKSVLDVGCGVGRSLDWFVEHGVECVGVEGSRLAISKAKRPTAIILHDLRKPLALNRQFDLVWCYEVAEHIHQTHLQVFLQTLTAHGSRIVLSAAHPGQGGEGHFNEQERDYWIKAFAAYDLKHNESVRQQLLQHYSWEQNNIYYFEKP